MNPKNKSFRDYGGKKPMDEDDAHDVFDQMFNPPDTSLFGLWDNTMPMGVVVAVATYAGYVNSLEDAKAIDQGAWWCGDYGWILKDIVALKEPIVARGMQGLWDLPADIANEVRRQMLERTALS